MIPCELDPVPRRVGLRRADETALPVSARPDWSREKPGGWNEEDLTGLQRRSENVHTRFARNSPTVTGGIDARYAHVHPAPKAGHEQHHQQARRGRSAHLEAHVKTRSPASCRARRTSRCEESVQRVEEADEEERPSSIEAIITVSLSTSYR